MKLSEHFSLEEMLRSDAAERNNFTEQYFPERSVIENLSALCVNVLEPLRLVVEDEGGVIIPSSGYRCPRVNAAVGSSPTSQHPKGEASDVSLKIKGSIKNIYLAKLAIMHKIPFDQMIIEFGSLDKPAWIHFSHSKTHNRGEILRIGVETNGNYIRMTPEQVLALLG